MNVFNTYNIDKNILIFLGIFLIIIIFLIYNQVIRIIEKWANAYSGISGPLETGCSSYYNIPELHPKYNSGKNYKFGLEKNSKYMRLKGFP